MNAQAAYILLFHLLPPEDAMLMRDVIDEHMSIPRVWDMLITFQQSQVGFSKAVNVCDYDMRFDCNPEGCKSDDCDRAMPQSACPSCDHNSFGIEHQIICDECGLND